MRIDKHVGCVNISLNTSRIDNNILEAQKLLNEQVVADCEPYVPFNQGALRNSVRYPQGIHGGVIEYDTPYAHYIYTGILYLTKDGRSFAQRHEKKYPTDRILEYHEPGTGSKWFESAKKDHEKEWIDLVKRTVGKD
ncbi:MAG: hypothetical protein IJO85_07470 [Lachnospiraceae bacterium]|nr:hypothetical protein [Lachnospiraceae bacterium]